MPPIAEQRAIGATLRAFDDQIAQLRTALRSAEAARRLGTTGLLNGILSAEPG